MRLGVNLNMEGKLARTEAALRGLRLHSLCVVLMSTFVQTVAFQINANRRPVLCVALYRWSPHWTWQHTDALLPTCCSTTIVGCPASPDHPPSVPADKCRATTVDIIVGLHGGRWPGDYMWEQEEPPRLELNKEPLDAAVFLEEMTKGLTRLDCINICRT